MSPTAQAETSRPTQKEVLPIAVLSNGSSGSRLQQALEQLGIDPIVSDDPHEVLAQITTGQGPVVLCDADLPSMNGLTFVGEALRLNPSAQIILVADSYSPDFAIQAIKGGARDYLPKSVQLSQLKTAIDAIADQLQRQKRIRQIERQLVADLSFYEMVGGGPAMLDVFSEAQRLARHYGGMLLVGPNGVGKEALARAVHKMSMAASRRFAVAHCENPTERSLENRLFGTAQGASPGSAGKEDPCLVEYANGGTIFVDEVCETSLAVQAKLLGIITHHEVRNSLSSEGRRVDIPIIAATARDLRAEVLSGRFREDLFCRLSAVQIRIPSLAERREDIPILVDFFLRRYNAAYHKQIQGTTNRAMSALLRYGWPGNVRELENAISAAALSGLRGLIDFDDLPEQVKEPPTRRLSETAWQPLPLREVRRDHIERVLEACRGNRVRAAQLLGIGRTSLYRFLKRKNKARAASGTHAA